MDPCFDHFPIVLVKGEFSIEASYGQAVVILDYEEGPPKKGSEFDVDDNSVFYGLILGKGCVELKDGAEFRGAIFVDGYYENHLCPPDRALEIKRGAKAQWSQCAVDRAMWHSGLSDFAEGTGGPARLLASRSFGEAFR